MVAICNILLEAVYCCFTRTTLFTTCLYDQSLRLLSHHQALYLMVFENCPRLFIVVLQELHCLPNCLNVFIIRVIVRYSTPSGF